MDNESNDRFRFDKRLRYRKGWVDPAQLDSHVAALPDVTDKATTLGEAAEGTDASQADAPAPGGDLGEV